MNQPFIQVNDPVGPAGIIAVSTRGRLEHNRILSQYGCSVGIFLSTSADLVAKNVVIGCATGIFSQSTNGARFVRNTAIGNPFSGPNTAGFDIRDTIAEFSGNVAIGNASGVLLDGQPTVFQGDAFYGNTSNCGVRNFTGGTLTATNNYWGAATGPGADPADAACDGPTVTTPFSTSDPTRAQSAVR